MKRSTGGHQAGNVLADQPAWPTFAQASRRLPCVVNHSMPRLSSLFLAFALLVTASADCGADDTIRVVTEDIPPYSMMVNGQVSGMSTEIVQAVFKEVGLQATVEVMPWARAYDLALNLDNVLIYSIARTPEREALFKWVGVIAHSDWYLYCLAERPVKLATLDDARGHSIATVQDDVGEQYLLDRGFTLGRELQSSNKYEQNYRKLKVDHAELWISDELNAVYLMRLNGDDPATTLIPALPIPELSEGGLSMAFSRNTPEPLVERFRAGLEAIHRNGTYDAIVKKWLAGAAR